jgi:single-stranded-DNA-specific exonuclease
MRHTVRMSFVLTSTASQLLWRARHSDPRAQLAISQQHGVSELLAGILVGRGVTLDDVPHFLSPTLRDALPDPFHLIDMDKAVARILRAVEAGERIAVFGDYDVDGATSTALLLDYLGALGADAISYIPDRMTEGYGPTVAAFETLIEGSARSAQQQEFRESGAAGGSLPPLRGEVGGGGMEQAAHYPTPPSLTLPARGEGFPAAPLVSKSQQRTRGASLILTVDCGTMAHAPIAFAQERGVDVIVLDHHLSSGALPNAHAIVNPNRIDETSAHRNLAAVGVTFLLLVALNAKIKESRVQNPESSEVKEKLDSRLWTLATPLPNLLSYLDLVALGTVCDVMPLTGLNRAFVAQGLKIMAQRNRLGLSLLSDVARMDEAPNVYHLGFLLGPRINAGGRVGKSSLGVELLTATDPDHARDIAAQLDLHNQERQAIEAGVLEQALALAETQSNLPVILVAREGWHEGVIGIVAARLKEKFNRPAMVVSLGGGVGKGSGRSVAGVDMGAGIMAAVAEGIILKGGGHAMAAGFSIAEHTIAALHDFLIARMEADVAAYTESRVMKYDGLLSVSGATLDSIEEIALAGPYGVGNPSPRFVIPNARIAHVAVMKEKHLRVTLTDDSGSKRLNAVAFHCVDAPLGQWLLGHKTLHLLGELKPNRWQGQESAQFLIADAGRP